MTMYSHGNNTLHESFCSLSCFWTALVDLGPYFRRDTDVALWSYCRGHADDGQCDAPRNKGGSIASYLALLALRSLCVMSFVL